MEPVESILKPEEDQVACCSINTCRAVEKDTPFHSFFWVGIEGSYLLCPRCLDAFERFIKLRFDPPIPGRLEPEDTISRNLLLNVPNYPISWDVPPVPGGTLITATPNSIVYSINGTATNMSTEGTINIPSGSITAGSTIGLTATGTVNASTAVTTGTLP